MPRRGPCTLLVTATPVLLAACVGAPDERDTTPAPTDVTHTSETLGFGAMDGLQVCGWSLGYLERFIELYSEASEDGDPGAPVEYYFVDAQTIRRGDICGGTASACARDGVVYADSPVHTHEAVHAIRQLQHGASYPGARFFEEGVAQLHFPVDVGWAEEFRVVDLPTILDAPMQRELYDPAANLLAVIGAARSFGDVERIVDGSRDAVDAGNIEGLIQDVAGVDLVGLDTLVSDAPRCSAAARMRMLVECAAEAVAWNEAPWSDAPYIIEAIGNLTCDDPRVLGPLDGRIWTFATIDVPVDGTYELDVESDDGQRLEITACDAVCGEDVDLRWDAGRREEELELGEGRVVVRLSRAVGDERGVAFRLRGPLP